METNFEYNTFEGFRIEKVENVKIVDITTLFEHVKNRRCDGNEEFYDFLIKWLAWIVQKPFEKTRVCPILKSKEGIGKGVNRCLSFDVPQLKNTYKIKVN